MKWIKNEIVLFEKKEKMMKTVREINCDVCCDEISNFSYLSCVKYCHLHTWFFAFLTLLFALFGLELLCDNGARMSMRYRNSGDLPKINASIYLLTWRLKRRIDCLTFETLKDCLVIAPKSFDRGLFWRFHFNSEVLPKMCVCES